MYPVVQILWLLIYTVIIIIFIYTIVLLHIKNIVTPHVTQSSLTNRPLRPSIVKHPFPVSSLTHPFATRGTGALPNPLIWIAGNNLFFPVSGRAVGRYAATIVVLSHAGTITVTAFLFHLAVRLIPASIAESDGG